MLVNQPISKPVGAREIWSETGIILQKGRRYDLSASGKWVDWFVPCCADGYSSRLLSPLAGQRRAPAENWFKLMGSIDRGNNPVFAIGRSHQGYEACADGELTCFANDLPSMYWNNWGYVTLTVTLLA